MRKVTWGENETAYDAVVNALFGDEKWAVGTYLVQIKRYLLLFRSLRGKQGPDLPER